MTIKSDSEKAADQLQKLGFKIPNCYHCVFFKQDQSNHARGVCNHLVALASKIKRKQDNDESNLPLFPLGTVVVKGEDGKDQEEKIPMVVGYEFGISIGACKWPEYFDPLYILGCMMFATKEDQVSIGITSGGTSIQSGIEKND